MTRIDFATPLGVGAMLGAAAGIVTGMMAGPVGAVVGLGAGALAGVFAGMAMHRDDEHRSARSRELDGIIGVTGGDMGAAPVSMPRGTDEPSRAAWAAEWLTPPPPVAG